MLGDDAAEETGGRVMRSMVSRKEGNSWASRRGSPAMWLWRFERALVRDEADDRRAPGWNSNDESDETSDSEGYDTGMKAL